MVINCFICKVDLFFLIVIPFCIKQRINDFRKSLNDTELQIVIVMEPDMTVQNLGSPALFPSSEAAGTREREESFLMRRLLLPYITMIVDPRAILDFGF